MSVHLLVSIAVDFVCVMHKKSMSYIFIDEAPGVPFDIKFLEELKRVIQFEEIDLPQTVSGISQASVKGKYIIVRSGEFSYTILVSNQRPNRFMRESIHAFGVRFENRWKRELKTLYTDLQGDITIFLKDSSHKASVPRLITEVFHLDFSLPHKIGMPTERMKGIEKKIWTIGEELGRGRGYVLLAEWIRTAEEAVRKNVREVANTIYSFTQRGFITPIPLKQFLEDYQ